jgi:hypothetical protein
VASDWDRIEGKRQWRTAQIKRFAERQRELREWINFAEIAECYSREDQSILPMDLLARDLLAGQFIENGFSRVLFMHPATPRGFRTRKWFKKVIDNNLDGHHGRLYLAQCWIPRRLFEPWRERNRLLASPSFEPVYEQPLARLKKPKSELAEYNRGGAGAKTRAVNDAIDQLWPKGIPKGLSAKDRNKEIVKQIKHNKSSVPTDVARLVQRVLKARRSR